MEFQSLNYTSLKETYQENQEDLPKTLYEKELELEESMSERGVARLQKRLATVREKNLESETPAGVRLVSSSIVPLASKVREFLEEASSGKAGRRAAAVKFLQQINPEVASVIALRLALDTAAMGSLTTGAAVKIGSQIEDEINFRRFSETKLPPTNGREKPIKGKVIIDTINKRLDRTNTVDYDHRKGAVRATLKRLGYTPQPWTDREKLLVGGKMIELMVGLGLVEVETVTRGRKKEGLLRAAPMVEEFVADFHARCEVLWPEYLPTVIPPKPWDGPVGGGYHSPRIRPLRLVKTRNANYIEELKYADMPMVYETVNRLQETPWRINRFIHETATQLWELGQEVAGLPQRDPYEEPTKPEDIRTNETARREWRRKAAGIHDKNRTRRGAVIMTGKILSIADEFSEFERFYFPHHLDFRGRLYAIPQFLQPQGNDLARGLLEFAEGKPVDNEDALFWLAVTGAGLYGVDKVSMQERFQWVLDHEDQILSSAADPIANRWWMDADNGDNAWQFLAFCADWAGFRTNGYGYVSHLPIQMDGTCNGLQIFSLLLRDPVGGEAVNLVPLDAPQDIYQRVADRASEKLRGIVEADPASEEAEQAERWLSFGIDRKITKRPVMTLPYGVTKYSVTDFINEAVVKRVKDTGEAAPWDDTFEGAKFLAPIVWEAIGDVVVAARSAMDWLQASARTVAKAGLPIVWHTPVGFPVWQAYQEMKSTQIQLTIGRSAFRPRLQQETGKLDSRRQANGISPNYVHSLDAAALMLTVHKAAERGVEAFSMIHDSYGTHAGDAEKMAQSLREAFVELFREDQLARLHGELSELVPADAEDKVESPPAKGTLDIEAVMESDYFFA